MIVSALFDVIGIGLIFPIVKILVDNEFYQSSPIISQLRELIGVDDRGEFVVFALIGLVFLVATKAIYAISLQYWIYRRLADAEIHFSQSLFTAYVSAPMSFLQSRNSSELLRNIYSSVPLLYNSTVNFMIQISTEVALISGLMAVLIVASPVASLVSAVLILCALTIFVLILSRPIDRLAKRTHSILVKSNQIVLETLEGVNEIRTFGVEKYFLDIFQGLRREAARASIAFKTISQIPRYYFEILITLVLVVVVFQFLEDDNTQEATAVLALYGVTALRMMPAATRIVTMINQTKTSIPAVKQLSEDVGLFGHWITESNELGELSPTDKNEHAKSSPIAKFAFGQKFSLVDISYKYDAGPQALTQISIDFEIGQAIGFVGPSGAGKSTIIGIILGLFSPQEGLAKIDDEILIMDDYRWRQHLGYVPQNIYLRDESIRKNIAFGISAEDIDDDKISRAVQSAQLDEYVASLPDGVETIVGERGVRLSGGQRQRIGIARALYNEPDIIIFDEATSSLDVETEVQITKVLHDLHGKKTLIYVAHRLSTIQKCDKIFFMSGGKIIDSGSFSELNSSCVEFSRLVERAQLTPEG